MKSGSRATVVLLSALCLLALSLGPVAAAAEAPAWNREVLERTPDWYATAEARRIADSVLRHQSAEGGWPKNTSLAIAPVAVVTPELGNTFDNDATTLPLAFLARVVQATADPAYRAAFDRGLDYVLAAQYPNGGWPQYFPLRGGYHDHITFNDDAMIRVMTLLREVAAGEGPYGFVDAARRAKAAKAIEAGVALILRIQLKQGGKLAVWCAQYDAVTLQPAWARKFEPPSLSGSESVGIVRFLMGIKRPSPEVVAAVEGAAAWFRASAVHDIRMVATTDAAGQRDRRYVREPGGEPLWARFYELETNRPIFAGRDSVIRYDFNDIERERRNGYSYYGTWPRSLLEKDYPAWRARIGG